MKFYNVCNNTAIEVTDQALLINYTPNTIERFHFRQNGQLVRIVTSKNMNLSCLSIQLDHVDAYLAQAMHQKKLINIEPTVYYLKKNPSSVNLDFLNMNDTQDTNIGIAFSGLNIKSFSYSKRISYLTEKNDKRYMYYSAENHHVVLTEQEILNKNIFNENLDNEKVDLPRSLIYREEFIQTIDLNNPNDYAKTCVVVDHQDQGLVRALQSLKVDVAFDLKLEEKDKSKIHASVVDQSKAQHLKFSHGLHLLIQGEILSRASNGDTIIHSPHENLYYHIEPTGFSYRTMSSPYLVDMLSHDFQVHVPVLELNKTEDSIYTNEYYYAYPNKSYGLKHHDDDNNDYDFTIKVCGELFDKFTESEHTNLEDDTINERFEWQVFEMNSEFSNEPTWGILEIKLSNTENEVEDEFTTFPPSFKFYRFEDKTELIEYLIKHSLSIHLGAFCSYMLDSFTRTAIYEEI